MKKILLALFSAGLSTAALAQPTFTAATLPTIGQVYTTQVYDSVGVSAGSSGANQTWTYNLTPVTSFSQTMVAPASTPYASQYPSANIASSDGAGSFGYQEVGATDIRLWGFYTPAYDLTYTDPMIYFTLPMTYMDTYTDDFAGSYTYGGGTITAARTGTHTVTYDAYGTLNLNGQTFTDVLRLYSHETYQDVTSFSTTNSTSDTYSWYDESGATMLLQVNWISSDFGGGTVINTKSVTGMANPSAVENRNNLNASFKIYGSVCNTGDNALVVFTSACNETATLELVDAIGRVITSNNLSVNTGANQFILNTDGLTGGVYFVRLSENGGQTVSTHKFIVH